MLSRAFNGRNKGGGCIKSPRRGEGSGSRSRSHPPEEEEEAFGHTTDLPVTFCTSFRPLGLRELLQSSVHVLGESGLGISEKVVLWDGAVFAAKRFRTVSVKRGEFGRRVEQLAHVSASSEYLVPLRAYLYAKRTKVVLCDYYPMGSLADLLAGARELGHTLLDWKRRFMIILHVARGIAFIHSTSHPTQQQVKQFQMNVHGNIKTSNVFIKTDFSACLSDYGFVQLAERPQSLGTRMQEEKRDLAEELSDRCGTSQKCDIHNFGVLVLDILGGSSAPFQINSIKEKIDEIKEGRIGFFEFHLEGRARKQALLVLEIALDCTTRWPSIDQILGDLREVSRI